MKGDKSMRKKTGSIVGVYLSWERKSVVTYGSNKRDENCRRGVVCGAEQINIELPLMVGKRHRGDGSVLRTNGS
jgi:hypothetical protein